MTCVRLLILPVLGLWLSGCASFASIAVETMDAKISQMRDERCHLANLVFGRSYCQSKRIEREEEPRHCVRTLGDVDCYALADPAPVRAPQVQPLQPPSGAAPDLRLSPAPRPSLAQR